MTTATPTYSEAVERLAEASAQLAAFAEQEQGAARDATAAALSSQITHAITVNPETERVRERVRAQCAAHIEEAAAYTGSTPEILEQLSAFVDRFAALADELVAFSAVAVEMDHRGEALFDHARGLGEPATAPQVFEGVMQALTHSPEGMAWRRLYMAGYRGRVEAADALCQLVRQLRRH
ncbi:hypothetical protein [Streptomyces hokutonensis]|uniref:Uncharacterized protein n=1 Tax=Streptomyces hokutonensis TaxID=1306990 RepID=A0ABW6MB60_9ACTN